MLTLDKEMLQALRDHNDITYTVDVTLAGSSSVDFTFTEDEIVAGGCQITRTNSSDTFPLGHVYSTQATLQVLRTYELENTDFFNSVAVIHGTYEYDDQEYTFDLGTYFLIDISVKGEIIQLVGYDGVYATDIPVQDNTKATLPLKATTVFRDCCLYLGINFNADYSYQGFPSVPSDWSTCNIMVETIPDGTTYRQLMGAIAVLFGAIAYISPFDNYMYVVPINSHTAQTIYWGGFFDSADPYASGDALDGGTFNPWTEGDSITGSFTDDPDIIPLNDPMSHPEFPLQDIVIDGVKAKDGNYRYPQTQVDGEYLLAVDISVYQTDLQSIIDRIGQKIAGFTFRPFELDYRSYPFADLGQRTVFEDVRHRTYASLITHIDMMLKGITTFKCTADTPARNGSTFESVAGRIKAVADGARQAAEQAAADAEQASEDAAQASADAASAVSQISGAVDAVGMEMMRLNSMMAMSMGMFESRSVNPTTGAYTYYLHNKQTLAASDIIWRRTANAFAVSTDGGTTWNAGIDADGHAVVNILSAIGIYADWIKTGTISSTNSLSSWNLDTGVFLTTDSNNTYRASFGGGTLGLAEIRGSTEYTALIGLFYISYYEDPGMSGGLVPIHHEAHKLAFRDHGNGMLFTDYDQQEQVPSTYAHVLNAHFSFVGSIGIYGEVRMDTFTLTCGRVQQSSDERLKDIHEWDDRYDLILDAISPILYSMKEGDDTKDHIGFSAQKVQKVISDLGIEDSGIVTDGGVYLSLDYNSLFSLMANKIKKQQKKIDELEQRISRLEKLMEDANGSHTV